MSQIKRSWDLLTDDQKKNSINEIIRFFENEREEEIGVIAAENVLDNFLETIGTHVYNKGIEDSISFMKESFDNIELDIESLLKK